MTIDVALIIKAIIILLIFGITLLIAMYSTYGERKVAAFMQDRIGPNRAGPFGLLQPLADAVKMFFKEDFIPSQASKWLFILGPCLSMLTALMTSAVIPFGDSVKYESAPGKVWDIPVQAIDVNIGILYVFGVVSLGVYGIMVGGWASNNKFSLLGAIRAASQNISYEISMGLATLWSNSTAATGTSSTNRSALSFLSPAHLRSVTVLLLTYQSARPS